jgi:hypothetical protein
MFAHASVQYRHQCLVIGVGVGVGVCVCIKETFCGLSGSLFSSLLLPLNPPRPPAPEISVDQHSKKRTIPPSYY